MKSIQPFHTEILDPTSESITRAAQLLIQGEVVALPTETVYGLAGNAFSKSSVEKIFSAKERPAFDPLIVHIKAEYLKPGIIHQLVQDEILDSQVLTWTQLKKIESALLHFWPGPLTCILPKGKAIPAAVTSGQNTVGLRMPSHAVFQQVLNELPFPLAAPSANRFGRISPTQAKHVMDELTGRIPIILNGGDCSIGVESTIIRIEEQGNRISLLRPGKIDAQTLEEFFHLPTFIGTPITATQPPPTSNSITQTGTFIGTTPGSLDEHYAPRKPLFLATFSFSSEAGDFGSFAGDFQEFKNQNFGKQNKPLKIAEISMSGSSSAFKNMVSTIDPLISTTHRIVLSEKKDLSKMAQSLFAKLREMDQLPDVDLILVDLPVPENSQTGLALAIADRLKRASRNKP